MHAVIVLLILLVVYIIICYYYRRWHCCCYILYMYTIAMVLCYCWCCHAPLCIITVVVLTHMLLIDAIGLIVHHHGYCYVTWSGNTIVVIAYYQCIRLCYYCIINVIIPPRYVLVLLFPFLVELYIISTCLYYIMLWLSWGVIVYYYDCYCILAVWTISILHCYCQCCVFKRNICVYIYIYICI